jgi:predicted acyl esterase
VAASPQAPISDFFFDDFHHHGAYLQSYFVATSTFGYQHNGPTPKQWYQSINPTSQDGWNFHMSLGPMSQAGRLFDDKNFFWKQLVEHPNYDEFWQKRSILPHLKNVKTNVMTVGGFFDAEDLYGPLNIYRELEKNNPDMFNTIVMDLGAMVIGLMSPILMPWLAKSRSVKMLVISISEKSKRPFSRTFSKASVTDRKSKP